MGRLRAKRLIKLGASVLLLLLATCAYQPPQDVATPPSRELARVLEDRRFEDLWDLLAPAHRDVMETQGVTREEYARKVGLGELGHGSFPLGVRCEVVGTTEGTSEHPKSTIRMTFPAARGVHESVVDYEIVWEKHGGRYYLLDMSPVSRQVQRAVNSTRRKLVAKSRRDLRSENWRVRAETLHRVMDEQLVEVLADVLEASKSEPEYLPLGPTYKEVFANVPSKHSVPGLMQYLIRPSGRPDGEVQDALEGLTGQRFGTPNEWEVWWAKKKTSFNVVRSLLDGLSDNARRRYCFSRLSKLLGSDCGYDPNLPVSHSSNRKALTKWEKWWRSEGRQKYENP